VATRLTAELGRPIRYEAASLLGYVHHLRRRGLPPRSPRCRMVCTEGCGGARPRP
jgi:hypothetical protein